MFKLVAVVAAVAAGYVFYHNVPDLKRYMRIRAM